MMKLRWCLIVVSFAASLQYAAASRVRVCGSVIVPEGVPFSNGELSVGLTQEKRFSTEPVTDTRTYPVDPVTRAYCVEATNSSPPARYRFRMHFASLLQPSLQVHTGNFEGLGPQFDGTMDGEIHADEDFDFYVDIVYLGNGDVLDRKMFFPGLLSYPTSSAAEDALSLPDVHAKLNKISSQTFSNGNLVSDGSFETESDAWQISTALTKLQTLSIRPQSGAKALVVSLPVASGSSLGLLRSRAFSLKPSHTYALSFYYKRLSGSGDVRPSLVTRESKASEESEVLFLRGGQVYQTAGQWTLYTETFTTGENAAFGQVSLLDHAPGTSGEGVFAFDNILLEEGSVSSNSKLTAKLDFFDGRNQNIQSLQEDGAKDILAQTVYDQNGKPTFASLPFAFDYLRHNGRHAYLEGAMDGPFGGHVNWYYGSPDPADPGSSLDPNSPGPKAKGYPYSETIYENSPLERVTESWGPGSDWRTQNRRSRTVFGAVNDPDGITGGTDEAPTPNNVPGFFYRLSIGEQNEKVRVFEDKFGRVVRTSAKLEDEWLDTDYEFDPLGNLTATVHPPGPGGTRTRLESSFNSLSQELATSSPDIGFISMVYGSSGELRFSSTTEQRRIGEFSYLKYDTMGRLIEAGEYSNAGGFTQSNANTADFPATNDPFTKIRLQNFYDEVPAFQLVCGNAPAQSSEYIIRPDATPGNPNEFRSWPEAYTTIRSRLAGANTPQPEPTFFQVYSHPGEFEYPEGDEYEPFPILNGAQVVDFELVGLLRDSDEYHEKVAPGIFGRFSSAFLKGRLVKSAVCNTDLKGTELGLREISTIYNYDKFGNVTDIYEYNGYIPEAGKRWQRTSFTYDVLGMVVEKRLYNDLDATIPEIKYVYSYDRLGRLDEIRDAAGTVQVSHSYNPIGQLSKVRLGQGSGQVIIEYTYHFRGWLKSILAINHSGVTLYSQDLRYEDGVGAQYNGNISEYDYALSATSGGRFSYTYDDLNRLTNASTNLADGVLEDAVGILGWQYHYFSNGALQQVTKGTNQLSYQYYSNSNQLERVNFSGSRSRRTDVPANFIYDNDGRMTLDESKEMDISYRPDGLPYRFTYTQERVGSPGETALFTEYMVYGEGGNRVSKMMYRHLQGGGLALEESKHYFSNGKEVRYSTGSNTREIYPFEGYGRLVPDDGGVRNYEFYVKNHLGTTVKVHLGSDNAQELYAADYEPLGHLRLERRLTTEDISPKFTGKELDRGLELTYFGARFYDADLGIWISPDPAMQYSSPYSYSPNPINGVDGDGNWFGDPKEVSNGTCANDASQYITEHQGAANSVEHNTFLEGWDISFGNRNPAVVNALSEIQSMLGESPNEPWATGNANSRKIKVHPGTSPDHATEIKYAESDDFGMHGHPSNNARLSLNFRGFDYVKGKALVSGDLIHVLASDRSHFVVSRSGDVYYTNTILAKKPWMINKTNPYLYSPRGSVKIGTLGK